MKKDTNQKIGKKRKLKKVNREADYSSDIRMNTCEMATKNSNMDCKYVCTRQNRERRVHTTDEKIRSEPETPGRSSKEKRKRVSEALQMALRKIDSLFSRQPMQFL